MFGIRLSLFKIYGFEVKIDLSWLVLGILITWSLASSFFPFFTPGLTGSEYLVMGIVGAIGILFSIVFHELSHSLVARRYGLPIKSITLFIFGGVAEMTEEPANARAEFMMAIAGPVSSILIAIGFYIIYLFTVKVELSPPIVGVIFYLGFINSLLALFNLIPGFPLDGGRVLRSGLWAWKKNLRWATDIASQVGSLFGMVLIFMGALSFIGGNFVGGLWWLLIGLFLRNAARMSYQQVIVKEYLEGEPVKRFMNPEPITIRPSNSVDELVEDYIYKYHFKMFPVLKESSLLGCVGVEQVKNIPKEEWSAHKVGEILTSCSPDNTIDAESDAVEALSAMNQRGISRLMVTENEKLVGLISLRDMMKFLSLKIDLEKKPE